MRVGIAYGLVAWITLQAADFSLDVIGAPNWILQVLVLVFALGLPAVLVFSWVFEVTPEGIKRESEIDVDQSITSHTGKKLNYVIVGVLVVAVAFLGYRQYMEAPPEAVAPQVVENVQSSIAVLPFEDYSEAGDQEHFSKGIAEEILNLLAKTNALRVAARTSSFAFAGADKDIREIGEKLDVGTVLEGSIRKSGNTIRITAQLINVEDGYHIWSETYDRAYEDIFKIQDEIAGSIMTSLRVHLLGEDSQAPQSERTADVDAYSAYLIGRERMALRTREDLEAAREQFEKSIEIDPEFAPARVQLAHAWLLTEQQQFGGKDIDRKTVDETIALHLERALELAPELPEAIAVQGYHDLRRYRFQKARDAFDKAISLNPNYAMAYGWRAEIAYEENRYLDMLADKEKAYSLDPMSLQISADLAGVYRNFWRPQDAERVINRMFDLHPDHPIAYQSAIGNLYNHGRFGEGLLMIEKALEANPENEEFNNFHSFGLAYLGLYDDAMAEGTTDVKLLVEVAKENWEEAEALLAEALNGEDAKRYYNWGSWIYSTNIGEGSQAMLEKMVNLDLTQMESEEIPWRDSCRPYLVNELRMIGRDEDAESIMVHCREEVEERFKAKYLCPCTWESVVLFTILDGRMDEAVSRADQWLTNGDSDLTLHVDPIFKQLADRPEYSDLLARNAAQIQRQRDIYLAGNGSAVSLN